MLMWWKTARWLTFLSLPEVRSVNDDYPEAFVQQAVYHVGADETGAAGD